MDKVIIKKEIIALANAIKGQADTIENSETISQAELTLLSGQIQELNKKVNVLDYLLSVPAALEPQVAEIIPEIEDEVQETPESIEELQVGEELLQEVELQEEPIEEEIIEAEPIEVAPVEEIKQEIPEPVAEPILEPEIIIPEIIVPAAPKMVIGINDKFQFMNELFAGKLSEYEKAVLQFNTVKTKEEANAYFQRLSEYSNWKENNETVKRLLNLVNNRFK
jgi:hypothetical protein